MRPGALATIAVCACAAATSAAAEGAPSSAAPDLLLSRQPDAWSLMSAAFVPEATPPELDPIGGLLEREHVAPGAGVVRWRSETAPLGVSQAGGHVDSLRIRIGETLVTPGAATLDPARDGFEPRAYEVAVTRDWPQAVKLAGDGYDLDVSPHAGLGWSPAGGQAEAGAMVRLFPLGAEASEPDGFERLGVEDGAQFGDRGRWYLFAAASGRAVGLNMLRQQGDWDSAGWTTDGAAALIGDAHVGVGWRQGPMQASLGYIHREVKGQHMVFGQETKDDQVVALSFTVRPGE